MFVLAPATVTTIGVIGLEFLRACASVEDAHPLAVSESWGVDVVDTLRVYVCDMAWAWPGILERSSLLLRFLRGRCCCRVGAGACACEGFLCILLVRSGID